MQKFELIKTGRGDQLKVGRRTTSLMRYPLFNKGSGFSPAERQRFNLDGLLPSQCNTIDVQAERIFKSIMRDESPLSRYIALAALQDRNEHLFYKVLSDNLEELMPIVYTPTVGAASRYFSHVFRRARGVWITPEHRGHIESVLRNAAPFSGVELIVVTDNESILGIGDQGAGGMAISIGKLALYCVGAGIHPARTLPISLDVGTDNQTLLDDPLYLGWREPRLRGDAYMEIVDEFVNAARTVFPDVVLQWEDFRKDNALSILDRYRRQVPSFNDDIQGTGAVAVACVLAACDISDVPFRDQRVLIFGAGAAGLGIARQLRNRFARQGLSGHELQTAILAMDSRGMISEERERVDGYKLELAWSAEQAAGLNLTETSRRELAAVIKASGATVLIGTSGQAGAFTEEAVKAVAENAGNPVILPMSNPTAISEAVPEDLLRWTEGRALVATGSPFPDVSMPDGPQPIGQANNVFIFPGLGLGTIISRAREVTSNMISAAALALAGALTDEERAARLLIPEVTRLWDVTERVATAVAEQAVADGVADEDPDLNARLRDYRWMPEYPEFIEGDIDLD